MGERKRVFLDDATASRLSLDREEVRALERRLNEHVGADRHARMGIGLGVLAMIAGGWLVGGGLVWLGGTVGLPRPTTILAAGIITPVSLIALWFLIFPRVMRRATRRSLRACGHDVCIGCGYLLTGLPADRPCPECGRTSQPALRETADSPSPE